MDYDDILNPRKIELVEKYLDFDPSNTTSEPTAGAEKSAVIESKLIRIILILDQ